MARKIENRKEAYIKGEVIDKLLTSRNWKIDDLLEELKREHGIDIGYKALAKLLNNNSNWKLTYAMAICELFDVDIKDLFKLAQKKLDVEN